MDVLTSPERPQLHSSDQDGRNIPDLKFRLPHQRKTFLKLKVLLCFMSEAPGVKRAEETKPPTDESELSLI